MIALTLVCVFFILLAARVPIVFCIGFASLAALLIVLPLDIAATTIVQQMATGFDSFTLLAIPFFILAGYLMSAGGLARRLIDAARVIVGPIPGGIAFTNILSNMVFGAVSGSAIASTSAVGSFMGPEMEKAGYPRPLSAAITVTSSTTGLLIPPSNVLIIFAVASGGVSISALFAAGYIPGVLMGLLLMLACYFMSRGQDIPTQARPALKDCIKIILRAVPALLLIFIIVGGIIAGVFTATESGAVAVLYALILSTLFYKEVSLQDFKAILFKSVETTGIVLFLVGFSISMAWVMAYANLPQMMTAALLSVSDNPIILLLLINILLLGVGAFLDITPAILIFTPILLPIGAELGMDPIHLGIMLVLNFSIGLCTPPVGSVLFVGSAIFDVSVERMMKPLLILFSVMIATLLLVTFIPSLSLFLPDILGLN